MVSSIAFLIACGCYTFCIFLINRNLVDLADKNAELQKEINYLKQKLALYDYEEWYRNLIKEGRAENADNN